MLSIFTNQTTNTDGSEVGIGLPAGQQIRTIFAWGTFGGASIAVEISPDGGTTWYDTSISFSAKGYANLEISLASGLRIRGQVSGVTTTDINLGIV